MNYTLDDNQNPLSFSYIESHFKFQKRDPIKKENKSAMESAVLCLIFKESDELNVLLTKRSEFLKNHPGEISFPGGRIEIEDRSPLEAALRETREEIGIPTKDIKIFGQLDEIITGTGFHIIPFIGKLKTTENLVLNKDEVTETLILPLSVLSDKSNHVRSKKIFNNKEYEFWKINYLHYNIWGATGSILVGLANELWHKQ